MSGPKGGSYSVELSAEELARRAQERARSLTTARYDELQTVLAEAHEELRRAPELRAELPASPERPGDSATTEEYRELDRRYSRSIAETRQAIAKGHRLCQLSMIASNLGRTTSQHRATTAPDLREGRSSDRPPVTTIQDRAVEVSQQVRPDALTRDRQSVEAILERLHAAITSDQQHVWLTELRHAVDLANRRATEADADAERARHLLADLRIHADEPQVLATALGEVVARRAELTDDLVEEVRAVVTAASAQAEASFVTASVAEILGDLGYVVDEGFATVLARDGLAHVRGGSPHWDDHGVRIRLDADRRELMFNVVRARGRPSSTTRDVALEEDWCSDLPAVLDGFDDLGIDLTIATRAAPGELAVMEVDAALLGLDGADGDAEERRQRRRRERRRPKERGQ